MIEDYRQTGLPNPATVPVATPETASPDDRNPPGRTALPSAEPTAPIVVLTETSRRAPAVDVGAGTGAAFRMASAFAVPAVAVTDVAAELRAFAFPLTKAFILPGAPPGATEKFEPEASVFAFRPPSPRAFTPPTALIPAFAALSARLPLELEDETPAAATAMSPFPLRVAFSNTNRDKGVLTRLALAPAKCALGVRGR